MAAASDAGGLDRSGAGPLLTRAFVLVSLANLTQALAFNLFLHFPAFLHDLGAGETRPQAIPQRIVHVPELDHRKTAVRYRRDEFPERAGAPGVTNYFGHIHAPFRCDLSGYHSYRSEADAALRFLPANLDFPAAPKRPEFESKDRSVRQACGRYIQSQVKNSAKGNQGERREIHDRA